MLNGVQGNTHSQLPLTALRGPTAASGSEQKARATDGEARKLLAQLFSTAPVAANTAAIRSADGKDQDELAPHLGRHLDVIA